jgi:hypothetical protein
MENILWNTLGTWRGHSENTLGTRKKWKKSFPSQNLKWKKVRQLECMFQPSNWLHEISLPKIIGHHFWPRLIPLAKNTLLIHPSIYNPNFMEWVHSIQECGEFMKNECVKYCGSIFLFSQISIHMYNCYAITILPLEENLWLICNHNGHMQLEIV